MLASWNAPYLLRCVVATLPDQHADDWRGLMLAQQ